MSKKRFGDRRLNAMSHAELLAYAKSITRHHGRAQEAINRLRDKLQMWEAGTPPAPIAPRPRVVLRRAPLQAHQEPQQETHDARTV